MRVGWAWSSVSEDHSPSSRARLELPGYTTLDELVAEIRAEVNGGILAGIATRMSGPDATELDALLLADPVRRRSRFDRVKWVAGAATVGHLKDHVKHLAELEAIGPTEVWLEGVLPAKVAHRRRGPGDRRGGSGQVRHREAAGR